jgi:hypothetical protein
MGAPRVGEETTTIQQAPAADDAEMVELRALAEEVVLAAGGVPRTTGYRPRLEERPRALATTPAELLAGLRWAIASSLRRRPMRTLAFGLAGLGVVAGALLLRSVLVPGDASLELATTFPHPIAVAPAPPPQETFLPASAPAPVVAVPAPVAPPRATPIAAVTERRTPPLEKKAHRRVARAMTAKRDFSPPVAHIEKKVATLDRSALIEGMRAIQPRVRDCYRKYNQKGVANLHVQVGSSGQVKAVTVSGPLASTRTGVCVKAAVRAARFRVNGVSFEYPLVVNY